MATLGYIGHSAFTIEHSGKTIAIDPFISGNPSATISPDDVAPSVILLTHAHNDHVGDTVKIAKRTGAEVVATHELAGFLGSKGVENAVGMNHGGRYAFDGGTVKMVPAWHTSAYQEEDGTFVAPGVPAGLIVTLGEGEDQKKIYFAGDTCVFFDMQLIGEEELDVAVLPVGDHFTMGPKDAIRALKFLRPKAVIPCHCNTFPLIEQNLDEFKKMVEDETQVKPVILDPGQTWEIE
ncbi:MAG: metal-dependent hydrolase [Chloroflexota bacterium]